MNRRVAFYAPMKPPGHPTPSGDRRMARLFLDALEKAGYFPEIASDLRVRDGKGDQDTQVNLINRAVKEVERLTLLWGDAPPALWFTYHCYYKAPDLIGPVLTDRFGIPYVIAEASRAQKRLKGPWATFAHRAETAIDRADLLLAMTEHDRFALDRDAGKDQKIADFPPFLDPGNDPPPKTPSHTLRLLTVAMMRGEDKMASYRALADAVCGLDESDWHLTVIGDGPRRNEVEALFETCRNRITFTGSLTDTTLLRQYYEDADVFIWPGVNEAYGMVYLEAQTAGTAVVAEDWPGPRSVIGPSSAIIPRGDAAAFRAGIMRVANTQATAAARRYVLDHHGIDTAAKRLASLLGGLI